MRSQTHAYRTELSGLRVRETVTGDLPGAIATIRLELEQSTQSAKNRGVAVTDHQAAYTQTADSRSTSPHRHSLSTPTPSTNYR